MIAVNEAIQIIDENTKSLETCMMDTRNALNYILAQNVLSPINLPPFNQSAMDGYAFSNKELKKSKGVLAVFGESKAGADPGIELQAGTAMRIFTGAPLPIGADTVVPQEMVQLENDYMTCLEFQRIQSGQNVRLAGEEVRENEMALSAPVLLNPAHIGYLISMGIQQVKVFMKPKIGILVTGNELAMFGAKKKKGQLFESNSHSLVAALQQNHFSAVKCGFVKDDYEKTKKAIFELITSVDALIITGGISVGDHDYVRRALLEIGVTELFYKVKQKPGKPMFFGRKEDCLIYALPGNPGSMLNCFYIYVLPSLFKMSGKWREFTRIGAKLEKSLQLKGERAHFLKGELKNGMVRILDKQNSSMLSSFASANCLVYLPEGKLDVNQQEEVEVILLP